MHMRRSGLKWIIVTVLIVLVGVAIFMFSPKRTAENEKITAAVVAGFIRPFQEIARAYEAKTGIKIDVTFSSAGRLCGQIINGAPFDIFLSADRERPDLLYSKAISEKPLIYVTGEVVLWSSNKDFCSHENWRSAICRPDVKKIAIPNPKTTVHGEVAQRVLRKENLWDLVESKLVYAPDIAQVFQWAATGAVDCAFCSNVHTYTEHGRKGCYYEMKDAPDVVYSACVIKNAKSHGPAQRFAMFLNSPEAEKIKKKYGYK